MNCLPDSQLQQMIEDASNDAVDEASMEHLGQCESCQQRLELLSGAQQWTHDTHDIATDGLSQKDMESLYRLKPAGSTQPIPSVPTEPNNPWLDDPVSSLLSEPKTDGTIGQFADYHVLSVLGRGGMGIVFKAIEPVLERVVAIKVLAPQLAINERSRQRFLSEARAVAKIEHPNVVGIYQVANHNGLPYIVMPCIEGESLEDCLNRNEPLGVQRVVDIATQVCKALDAAHGAGIVHRDIKPGNLLMEASGGQVKVTDFGLARVASDVSLTQTGFIAGTPQFMSPEHASGQPVDHRSDIYSLGAVMYTMLGGRPPFTGEHPLSVVNKVIHETPLALAELWAANSRTRQPLPPWLATLVHRTLAKNPDDRPQSADQLRQCLTEQSVATLPQPVSGPGPGPGPVDTLQPTSSVGRNIALLAGGLLVAACVGFVIFQPATEPVGHTETAPSGANSVAIEAEARPAPFVCTVKNTDGTQANYVSLEEALHKAPENSVIQLSHSGPFRIHAPPEDLAVHIRGFAEPDSKDAALTKLEFESGSWGVRGQLKLTGVSLGRMNETTDTPNNQHAPLIEVNNGHLTLQQCQLVSFGTCIATDNSAVIIAENSLLAALGTSTLMTVGLRHDNEITIDNSLLLSETLFTLDGSGFGPGGNLTLRDSTLYSDYSFRLNPGGPASPGSHPLNVAARGNVIQTNFLQVAAVRRMGNIANTDLRARTHLQDRIRWRGDSNLFSIRDGFTGFELGQRGFVAGRRGARTLTDWRDFCEAEGESSAEAATAVLRTLKKPSDFLSADVQPGAFALNKDSSGAKFGADRSRIITPVAKP